MGEKGKILAVSIFKGGTGKTTTAVSLAAALAKEGQKVLLIDLDQQASATRHVGLDPHRTFPSLVSVFTKEASLGSAIKELPFGFHIIPGNELLAAIEEALEPKKDETALKDLILDLREDFDYIVLDSPPGKGMFAINALVAADEVVVPLQAQRAALEGVDDLLRFIRDIIWKNYNDKLRFAGILPTMYKRTTTHSPAIIQKARNLWSKNVFPLEVPDAIAFSRAFTEGKPISVYDPNHEGSHKYAEVARLICEKHRPQNTLNQEENDEKS